MKVWRQTCGEQAVSVKLFSEGEFYNIFLYIFYCHFRLPAKYTKIYWYKRTHNIYLDINSQSRLHKFFHFTHNSAMTNNTWSASLYSMSFPSNFVLLGFFSFTIHSSYLSSYYHQLPLTHPPNSLLLRLLRPRSNHITLSRFINSRTTTLDSISFPKFEHVSSSQATRFGCPYACCDWKSRQRHQWPA